MRTAHQSKRKTTERTRTERAVDGFTREDVSVMSSDNLVTARCVYCESEKDVEPDARKSRPCGGARPFGTAEPGPRVSLRARAYRRARRSSACRCSSR